MSTEGSQKVDPYKAKNHDDAPLPEKVDDLSNFISECKFGMLTTRLSGNEDALISRCMSLAAMVCNQAPEFPKKKKKKVWNI